MKILVLLLQSALILVLCIACKKTAEPKTSSVPLAEPAPAFKIAEPQRQALEQAQQVEQDLSKAGEAHQKQIEEATK